MDVNPMSIEPDVFGFFFDFGKLLRFVSTVQQFALSTRVYLILFLNKPKLSISKSRTYSRPILKTQLPKHQLCITFSYTLSLTIYIEITGKSKKKKIIIIIIKKTQFIKDILFCLTPSIYVPVSAQLLTIISASKTFLIFSFSLFFLII